MYDLYKEGGLKELALGIPAPFGVGVQTYGSQIPNLETTPAGKATIKLKPVPGLSEDIMNKIRGVQPSNIPLEQQQPIVKQMQAEQQEKISKDKLKQQLEKGELPKEMVKQNLETAKLLFKYSEAPYVAFEDKLLYKNEEGNVLDLSLNFDIPTPKSTGNETLDKELLSDYRGKITSAKNAVMKAFDLGYFDQGQTIDLLEKLTAQANATKAPKKPKKITVSAVKVPKFKINIRKGKTYKVKKMKITMPKAKKLSIKAETLPRAKVSIAVKTRKY
jgi:hypothetical protein